MTSPDNPFLRQGDIQLGLGSVLRQGDRRPARRSLALEPARPPRTARRPGPAFCREEVRPPRPDPDRREFRGLRPLLDDRARQRAGQPVLLAPDASPPHRSSDGGRPGPSDRRATSSASSNKATGDPERSRSPTRRPRAASSRPSAAAPGSMVVPPSPIQPAFDALRLLLVIGNAIEEKISSREATWRTCSNSARAPTRSSRTSYLRALCRPPTSGGTGPLDGRAVAGCRVLREAVQDLFWGVAQLQREFAFNH